MKYFFSDDLDADIDRFLDWEGQNHVGADEIMAIYEDIEYQEYIDFMQERKEEHE